VSEFPRSPEPEPFPPGIIYMPDFHPLIFREIDTPLFLTFKNTGLVYVYFGIAAIFPDVIQQGFPYDEIRPLIPEST